MSSHVIKANDEEKFLGFTYSTPSTGEFKWTRIRKEALKFASYKDVHLFCMGIQALSLPSDHNLRELWTWPYPIAIEIDE